MAKADDFECPGNEVVVINDDNSISCAVRKTNGEFMTTDNEPTLKEKPDAITTNSETDPSELRATDSEKAAPPSKDVVKTGEDGPDGEVSTTVTTNDYGTGTVTETTPYDEVLKKDERMAGAPRVTPDRMEGPGAESRYETEQYQDNLLVDGGLNNFDKGLEGFFGQKFSAYSTRQTAWNNLIDIAKEKNLSPYDLLDFGRKAYRPDKKAGGSGGTSRSFSEANEDDVRLLANNLSEEMIGRRINDKEFEKLLSKVRKEEQANPTVTTRTGKTSRTSGGVTTESRNEAMREVLVENPEFKEFQMGEGALRYTQRYIEEQSRKASL
jgi:hypothetical protein